MQLKPSIATYSGETAARVRSYLSEEYVLDIIAEIAAAPRPERDYFCPHELKLMHIVQPKDGLIRLNTAVFLEPDIERIVPVVKAFAKEVARGALYHGAEFLGAPPEVACFLGGIIGLQQGLGKVLEEQGLAGEWKTYKGIYPHTKVDFDEICPAYEALGPDLQNKSVLRGERFTAVFIGPGGPDFRSLAYAGDPPETSRYYFRCLNHYLVDVYALLLLGEIEEESLMYAARAAGLFDQDGRLRTSVISQDTVDQYREVIEKLTAFVSSYYMDKLPQIEDLLATTASGRQGVSAANQMMHFWRYVRRATAQQLYALRFLIDPVPQDGSLTVFYANDISYLEELI
jgi:hypothetical protein